MLASVDGLGVLRPGLLSALLARVPTIRSVYLLLASFNRFLRFFFPRPKQRFLLFDGPLELGTTGTSGTNLQI